jgi:GAF domain-containing protein
VSDGAERDTTLTDVYSALARVVLVDRELDDVLSEICTIARDAVPGAEATSITLMQADKAWTAAHTGEMALQADEIQYATGHGPCMDAGRTGMVLLSNDLASETRWPDYAPRVVEELPVRSSLSAPLPFQGAMIGGLNTYATRPDAYGPESTAAAEAVAAHIAVAVMNADAHEAARNKAHHLQVALDSRKVIDMALGILVATHRCSPDEAFAILSRASQNRNQKLRDLAAVMVESTMSDGSRPGL